MEIKDRTIALLIDSDNMSREYYAVLLDELSQFGRVTYRRLYGDFTRPKQNGWQAALLEHSIEQRQQSNYTKGKNATDSSMIIDAMDILYGGKVDCFCLATSDSDFTGLAMRFRNDNLVVIGAGEKKTPNSFRRACDRFIAVDELLSVNCEQEPTVCENKSKAKNNKQIKKVTKKSVSKVATTSTLPQDSIVSLNNVNGSNNQNGSLSCIDFIGNLIEEEKTYDKKDIIDYAVNFLSERADEYGWLRFSVFVDGIYRKFNDFNPKLYGQKNSHATTFFKAQQLDGKQIFEFSNINNIVRIKLATILTKL
ncbi:MAG: NYN domain-containing protein [Clostridiales bacterium]|jgi:uncharacterized protein (TIGR00288 family)|nr:NYN domain-containing protein [Clostridiales bacterium]